MKIVLSIIAVWCSLIAYHYDKIWELVITAVFQLSHFGII